MPNVLRFTWIAGFPPLSISSLFTWKFRNVPYNLEDRIPDGKTERNKNKKNDIRKNRKSVKKINYVI